MKKKMSRIWEAGNYEWEQFDAGQNKSLCLAVLTVLLGIGLGLIDLKQAVWPWQRYAR